MDASLASRAVIGNSGLPSFLLHVNSAMEALRVESLAAWSVGSDDCAWLLSSVSLFHVSSLRLPSPPARVGAIFHSDQPPPSTAQSSSAKLSAARYDVASPLPSPHSIITTSDTIHSAALYSLSLSLSLFHDSVLEPPRSPIYYTTTRQVIGARSGNSSILQPSSYRTALTDLTAEAPKRSLCPGRHLQRHSIDGQLAPNVSACIRAVVLRPRVVALPNTARHPHTPISIHWRL